jgi:hypothetical protein
MIKISQWLRIIFKTITPILTGAALSCVSGPASAFMLFDPTKCNPGQKWDVSQPVKVRLLGDSVFTYLNGRGTTASLVDLDRINRDVRAVIDLYNAIPGNRLKLELGQGITGDSDLDEPGTDNFGAQTVVVGFTKDLPKDGSGAEAWTQFDPHDGCTRSRAHIRLQEGFYWIFGPPDTTDVDGRSFTTTDQTPPAKKVQFARSFLGILTHEMGHAVGLKHPDHEYGIMAQNFRTWFRGRDEVLHTRLLPDDTAGILALYGTSNLTPPLDISVANSWFEPAEAQTSNKCTTQIANLNAATKAVSDATGLPISSQFPAQGIFKGEYANLFEALASAQEALSGCVDGLNAMQTENCVVSSRADDWNDAIAGKLSKDVSCGLNKGSTYPKVSDAVCPGQQVQIRYTLNNHTSLRDVQVKSEAWFSEDTKLDARNGGDFQSPDVRELALKAATSANPGHVFRLPANAPTGKTLYVFVRAIPYDSATGESLFGAETDQWNNAIMVRHSIRIDPGACS